MIDFKTLRLTWKPNQYLVLPAGHGAATPHRESPRYQAPVETLFDALRRVIADEPRTRIVAEDRQRGRIAAICRSRIIRFPDLVSLEAVSTGEGGSALLVYSRARYGVRDFGVNKARVERWIARLDRDLASH